MIDFLYSQQRGTNRISWISEDGVLRGKPGLLARLSGLQKLWGARGATKEGKEYLWRVCQEGCPQTGTMQHGKYHRQPNNLRAKLIKKKSLDDKKDKTRTLTRILINISRCNNAAGCSICCTFNKYPGSAGPGFITESRFTCFCRWTWISTRATSSARVSSDRVRCVSSRLRGRSSVWWKMALFRASCSLSITRACSIPAQVENKRSSRRRVPET